MKRLQIVYNINKIMLNVKKIIMTSYFHNGAGKNDLSNLPCWFSMAS